MKRRTLRPESLERRDLLAVDASIVPVAGFGVLNVEGTEDGDRAAVVADGDDVAVVSRDRLTPGESELPGTPDDILIRRGPDGSLVIDLVFGERGGLRLGGGESVVGAEAADAVLADEAPIDPDAESVADTGESVAEPVPTETTAPVENTPTETTTNPRRRFLASHHSGHGGHSKRDYMPPPPVPTPTTPPVTDVRVNLVTIDRFDADDVDLVFADLGAGNDRFTNRTDLPSIQLGGEGDDRLRGGSNTDVLVGGPGEDDLDGRGGDDVILDE